jgi:transposase
MIALEGRMHPVGIGIPWVAGLNGPWSASMPYDYHIGIDHHKAYSHIVVQNTDGKTLRSGRVRNNSQLFANFLLPSAQNAHAVMEATRNWTVMFDWLDDICDEDVLAHPLKVKAIADAIGNA